MFHKCVCWLQCSKIDPDLEMFLRCSHSFLGALAPSVTIVTSRWQTCFPFGWSHPSQVGGPPTYHSNEHRPADSNIFILHSPIPHSLCPSPTPAPHLPVPLTPTLIPPHSLSLKPTPTKPSERWVSLSTTPTSIEPNFNISSIPHSPTPPTQPALCT